MPIIRKVVPIGNSKAVFLPKSWFDYYEEHEGITIENVAIEVNRTLKISPLPTKKECVRAEFKHRMETEEPSK